MTIIEIAALSNGAHRNQTGGDVCPEGWAIVPDELLSEWQACAPFAEITVDGNIVTGITPVEAPEPEPEPEPEPDPMEQRIAELEQRNAELEDAIIELAAIIAGEEE